MTNLYVGRETLKRAAHLGGGVLSAERDKEIDRIIETYSRRFDRATRRFYIPIIQTRLYRWPSDLHRGGTTLWLDQDLISITTLKSEAQNSSPTTIAADDYFLEPNNTGPPFNRIEIDLSSSAAFQSGDTPQRSISVLGSWGYSGMTRSVGTVSSGLSSVATDTTMVCSDASLIDVGDTLLIDTEQIFVADRVNAANGSELLNDANVTALMSNVSITVDTGSNFNAGEVILVDSERMLITSITGNVLTVVRTWEGTVLAAHADDAAVHVFRSLTIERGVNGTTAATHTDATAISKYEPPFDVTQLVMAECLNAYQQGQSAWGGTAGGGEAARELDGIALSDLRKRVIGDFRKVRSAAI